MAEEEEEALSLYDRVVHNSRDDEGTKAVAERLICLSRSPDVRGVLATRDAVTCLLPLIDQDTPALLLLLRLLRNLCAGNSFNQDSFLCADGVNIVARVVDRSLELKTMEMVSILQVSLQLLGNICGAGSSQRFAVWKAFFSDRFRTLALLENEGKIMEPLCMVIYTCCHDDINRQKELCLEGGALLLASCLQAARAKGFFGDWISLLLVELLSEKFLVPRLFASLQGPYEEAIQVHVFTPEQATLLGCLLDGLDEERVHENLSSSKIDFLCMVEFLAQVFRDAIAYHLQLYPATSIVISHVTGPSGIPVIDVLGYTLELLRLLSGLDCGDKKQVSRYNRSSIVCKLLQVGVIELCLELLKGLGPPELIMRTMQRSNGDVMNTGHGLNKNHVQEGLQMKNHEDGHLKTTMTILPYQGFRRDLVAVIGNAAYQERAVQDAVRHWGGLFLMLQQCVVDDANPYLREWGLWAIRNLVDGNIENSKEFAELQLRGMVTPIELAEMGYKVEIDSELGRPKLVNLPS